MSDPPFNVSVQSERSNVTFLSFVLVLIVFKAGGSSGTTAMIVEQTSLVTSPISLKAVTFVNILRPAALGGSLVIV